MEVTNVSIAPKSGCPDDKITVTVWVRMGAFWETGDVNIYSQTEVPGNSSKFTDWKWLATIPSVSGGALGGDQVVSAKVTAPTRVGERIFIGAKGSLEPKPTTDPMISAIFHRPDQDVGSGVGVTASPLRGEAPLKVTFSTFGMKNASDVKWRVYEGDDVYITIGRGKTITHTFLEPGGYVGIGTPLDRCGDEYYYTHFTDKIVVTAPRCKNPDGAHGDFDCSGTTRIRCNKGVWETYEKNSKECDYVAPGPGEPEPPGPGTKKGCTNPTGVHGAFDCQGTTRIQCDDGAWKVIEWNSPHCPGNGGGNGQIPNTCSNPYGRAGDTYYRYDGALMRCTGSEWVVQEYPSPSPSTSTNQLLYMGIGVLAIAGIGYMIMKTPRK